MRSSRQRPDLVHPPTATLDLLDVLHALADPTRMTIVATLVIDPERACGTFPVEVAASTLSHHFRVLREAGVIHQRDDGNRRWTSLRAADLEKRFPGVVETIVDAWHQQQSQFALMATGTPDPQDPLVLSPLKDEPAVAESCPRCGTDSCTGRAPS